MRTISEQIFSRALVILLFIGAVSPAMAVEQKQAHVSQVIQDVRLLEPHGVPRPAAVNDKITEEMGVRTGVQSRAELIFADLTLTRLGRTRFLASNRGSVNSISPVVRSCYKCRLIKPQSRLTPRLLPRR